jgi:hypothetical protein
MSSEYNGYANNGNGDEGEEEQSLDDFFGGYNDNNGELVLIDGGSKKENERTFSVESSNVGSPSYEGGRFISTSAYNAAKKAATAIFRHVDNQMGVVKGDKKGKAKHVKKVEFVLYRHDKKNPVKYYKYEAERVQADKPVVVKRVLNKGTANEKVSTITFSQSVTVRPLPLDEEYVNRNKDAQKEHAAKKRAQKKKEEAKLNPEKKTRKAKKPAAEKKAKKITSIQEVIEALSVTPKKKVEKKPKAAADKKPKAAADKKPKAAADKKPKAAADKKPKAAAKKAKKIAGGGYCSFF